MASSDMRDSFDEIAAALGLIRISSPGQKKPPLIASPFIPIPQRASISFKTKPKDKAKKKTSKRKAKKKTPKISKPPPPPPENNRKTLRKFFENSNIPFTGGIGLKLVQEYDNFTAEEAKECLARQEAYCGTSGFKTVKISAPTKPKKPHPTRPKARQAPQQKKKKTNCKKNLKKNSKYAVTGHCHVYTFNKSRRQRLIRQQELVLGMNESSFANFNQCRPLTIVVDRVSTQVVKKYRRWNFLKEATLKRLQPKIVLVNNKDILKFESNGKSQISGND